MNLQKVNFLWIIILLMLTLTKVNVAKPDKVTQVKVNPYASVAQTGESFTVNITVSDVENLYGVELTLRWNASTLRVVNVDVRLGVESHLDGVLHEPVLIVKNETIREEGKYLLAGTSHSEAPPFSGNGNILRITFNVTSVGSCKLDVEAKLADWPPPNRDPRISWSIIHETIDGFFGREIKLTVLPDKTTVNSNITLSGSVIPPQRDLEVEIFYQNLGETDWNLLANVTTDEQGSYSYIWIPEKSGRYYIKSTTTVLGAEETSPVISVDVNEPEQPVRLYAGILAAIVTLGIAVILVYYKRTRRRRKTL